VADVEGQALAALVANSVRGTMKIAAVKPPRYGEERRNILKDISASIGATFITREKGIQVKNIQIEHFGQCKSISINKGWTTIVGGKGDYNVIEERIEALKSEIKQTESLKECERIQERVTRLASGVAVIRVGAATEVEMIEKKHRIDDALEAVRSAQEEGIVPGGGIALLRSSEGVHIDTESEEQSIGAKIILEAVESPLRQMARNAGKSPDLIVDRVRGLEQNKGYNFMSESVVDMLSEGIVDPTKVTRCALQNAVSVASTLITTSHAIVS
jgi:chaperonin GroEL